MEHGLNTEGRKISGPSPYPALSQRYGFSTQPSPGLGPPSPAFAVEGDRRGRMLTDSGRSITPSNHSNIGWVDGPHVSTEYLGKPHPSVFIRVASVAKHRFGGSNLKAKSPRWSRSCSSRGGRRSWRGCRGAPFRCAVPGPANRCRRPGWRCSRSWQTRTVRRWRW